MANVLNYEAQIGTGQVIQPWHISQSVDAFTGAEAYDITISGSLVTTGSIKGTTTLTIGSNHTNTGTLSSIAGGNGNIISSQGDCSFIGGGLTNTVSACYSIIGSGQNNCIRCDLASWSVIGGGRDNLIYSNV
jgi:hypothetical protein